MNIELLKRLLKIIGDVTLSEAVTWLEVEENAKALREEGHDPRLETKSEN